MPRARRGRKSALFTQLACVNSPPSSPLVPSPCSTGDFGHVDGRSVPSVPSFLLLPSFSHGTMTEWSLRSSTSSIPIVSIVDRCGGGSRGSTRLAFTTDSEKETGTGRDWDGGGGTMHLSHFTHRKPEEVVPCIERGRLCTRLCKFLCSRLGECCMFESFCPPGKV